MIPYFEDLILPFLKLIKDGREHTTVDVLKKLAEEFKLKSAELNEYLPSGKKKVFDNRVHWAKAHLKMADFIENIKPGLFKITKEGKKILSTNPDKIDIKFLNGNSTVYHNKFFIKIRHNKTNVNEVITKSTPEEEIGKQYKIIKENLKSELLLKIKNCTPKFFEELVLDLLLKMGYGDPYLKTNKNLKAGIVTGKSGDGGIDGIIYQDRLGLETILIQAKLWKNTVGSPEIRNFIGALKTNHVNKGVILTTAHFSEEAIKISKKEHNETKVVLIDGNQLTEYMIEYNLGVTISNQYEYTIKIIDNNYFDEE